MANHIIALGLRLGIGLRKIVRPTGDRSKSVPFVTPSVLFPKVEVGLYTMIYKGGQQRTLLFLTGFLEISTIYWTMGGGVNQRRSKGGGTLACHLGGMLIR